MGVYIHTYTFILHMCVNMYILYMHVHVYVILYCRTMAMENMPYNSTDIKLLGLECSSVSW